MPGFARVQVTLQGATNLPEDRFVNTFHMEWFGDGATFENQAPVLAGAVESFFMYEAGGTGYQVIRLLSPFITTITTSVYDLSLPEGEREPYTIFLPVPASDGQPFTMPEEVAVCLTLHGAPPITPRRRGRLFIGPLAGNSNVVVPASELGPTRVNIDGPQSIGNLLLEASSDLITNPLFAWCIRSVTPVENFVNITGVWVDDAFDTMRKRGVDPTRRRELVPT